jgi:hypothetical protein
MGTVQTRTKQDALKFWHNSAEIFEALATAGYVVLPADDLEAVAEFRDSVDAFLTTLRASGVKIDNSKGSTFSAMALAHSKIDGMLHQNSETAANPLTDHTR